MLTLASHDPKHNAKYSEIDALHDKYFSENDDLKSAHQNFLKSISVGFSPLTECAALAYANDVYHADIFNIEQYFNVQKGDLGYDIVLVVAEEYKKYSKRIFVQATYKCVEEAMRTCNVINRLFKTSVAV
jgi:hypothetical protein